jgi:outer membrane protein assembly factor BamB
MATDVEVFASKDFGKFAIVKPHKKPDNSKFKLLPIVQLILVALFLEHYSLDAGRIFAQDSAKTKPVALQNPSNNANPKAQKSAAQELVAEAGAISTSQLALPFKRLWLYADDMTTLAPTTDEGRIYLPLAGGRVVCLDSATGSRIWSSEPGGIVSAPVAIGETSIYIATRKFAEDGTEAGASLRAVDKLTGLTLWAKDFARPFTSPLTFAKKRLYAGSADGSLYAIATADGETIWKAQTQDIIRGGVWVSEAAIYFGSDDGALRGVEADTGREIWKFQTKGKIRSAPVTEGHTFYFGSSDGFVYAVDKITSKVKWQSRSGAAIEASPVLVEDKILVASFDNFVYALSRTTGNKIWKRRMENRLAAAPIVEGDAAMIAPLRGEHVAVFLHQDGRRVNYYRLDKEFEIVAEPVFSNRLLLLATNKGLVAAIASPVVDTHNNSLKKEKP